MSIEVHATAAAEEITAHLLGGISDACPECVDILSRHMQELVSPLQERIDLLISEIARLEATVKHANGERIRTQDEIEKIDREVVQTLGKALHYPWFKDDQKNFPGATEADGVAVGDHVAETLAVEAAKRIAKLEELGPLIEEYRQAMECLRLRDTIENLVAVDRVGAQIKAILNGAGPDAP